MLTDRARPQRRVWCTLQLTPQWAGTATVTDVIDGTPATLSTSEVAKAVDTDAHTDWVDGPGPGDRDRRAAIASRLQTSANVRRDDHRRSTRRTAQSVGQQLTFPVTAGQTYTVTKYVGVELLQAAADPTSAAQAQATQRRQRRLRRTACARTTPPGRALWAGRIDVLGNHTLATDVNASQFYLWSSTRAGVDWSISPAGLSSNGYDGHIFWDAETWMYPSLLAQHPDARRGHERLSLRAAGGG